MEPNEPIPQQPPSKPRRSTVRRHSYGIYVSVVAGVLILGTWGYVRLLPCIDEHVLPIGLLRTLLCNFNKGVYIFIASGILFVYLLLKELHSLGSPNVTGSMFLVRQPRALWNGFKSLEKGERKHPPMSILLLAVFIIIFIWIMFFNRIKPV